MEVHETIDGIRELVRTVRRGGRTIAVVPTMGGLHAGHAALIDAAVADGHFVVVTIFLNPTQFGSDEDLDRYPRTREADLALCRRHGASAVFLPSITEVYPRQGLTTVNVTGLTEVLCGRRRPSHFSGVCTVVAKLFNVVAPDVAYFGRKDAQQAVVVRRMIEDLNFPIDLVVCPIVRHADGLAISTRNKYLSPPERAQAPQLYASLNIAAEKITQGATDPAEVILAIQARLAAEAPLGEIDYVEIVDPDTLQAVEEITAPVLVALAVRFDRARLIDNVSAAPAGL